MKVATGGLAYPEQIATPNNLGAVFRSAAALDVDAVLLSPRCADPLYRRSVRVSMGTVFQVPWARLTAWPGGLVSLKDAGFTTAALALSETAQDLDTAAVDGTLLPALDRLALVLGTEGAGLSREAIEACDAVVRIPMSGGVDSLNVAAAAAVAFWHTRPMR
ncbi:RNA methyltransferase [Tersicoccus sp. MR15.9]